MSSAQDNKNEQATASSSTSDTTPPIAIPTQTTQTSSITLPPPSCVSANSIPESESHGPEPDSDNEIENEIPLLSTQLLTPSGCAVSSLIMTIMAEKDLANLGEWDAYNKGSADGSKLLLPYLKGLERKIAELEIQNQPSQSEKGTEEEEEVGSESPVQASIPGPSTCPVSSSSQEHTSIQDSSAAQTTQAPASLDLSTPISNRRVPTPVPSAVPASPVQPQASSQPPRETEPSSVFAVLADFLSGETDDSLPYMNVRRRRQYDGYRPPRLPTTSRMPNGVGPSQIPIPMSGPTVFDWTGRTSESTVLLDIVREGEGHNLLLNNPFFACSLRTSEFQDHFLAERYLAGEISQQEYWNLSGPGSISMRRILLQIPNPSIPGGHRYFVGGLRGSSANPRWFDETEVPEELVVSTLQALAKQNRPVSLRGGWGRPPLTSSDDEESVSLIATQSDARSDITTDTNMTADARLPDLIDRIYNLERKTHNLPNPDNSNSLTRETRENPFNDAKQNEEYDSDLSTNGDIRSRPYQANGFAGRKPNSAESEYDSETTNEAQPLAARRNMMDRKSSISSSNSFSSSGTSSIDDASALSPMEDFAFAETRALCWAVEENDESPWPFTTGSLAWDLLYASRTNKAIRQPLAAALTRVLRGRGKGEDQSRF